MNATETYGIGAVARMTGLSDHTIRVWERRYEAVVAERSGTGRRVYTTADVEKLKLLKLLTDRGVKISRVANATSDELKSRLASMTDISVHAGQQPLSVALIGDFLPALVRTSGTWLGPLAFTIVENDLDCLEADLKHQDTDAIVVELAAISPDTPERIEALRKAAGARFTVVVYSIARSADLEKLAEQGVTLLRAPASLDEVAAALTSLASFATPAVPGPTPAEDDSASWTPALTPAPRRFTRDQLALLSRVTTSIDCECPRHLAQLVADLTAFEIYSASCANRDDEDKALHDYLHRMSGTARGLVEEALERVAKAEGLQY